jgi:ABC-2 type transport system permease protein
VSGDGVQLPSTDAGFLANTWLIARREVRERVRGRLFFVSTVLLAGLAVAVALTPILVKMVDRGSTTTIVVAGSDDALTLASVRTLESFLNPKDLKGEPPPYAFTAAGTGDDVAADVLSGRYAGALLAYRQENGQVQFQLLVGESLAADKVTQINVGILAIAIFDFMENSPTGLGPGFQVPTFDSAQVGASGGGAAAVAPSEYAGRRIVGVVFVVLIFITLVIYGMWVAAGVVAEKSSRVMELLISAASPAELVTGKVIGIGLAGFVQYVAILLPALATLLLSDRIAIALLGTTSGLDVSLGVLTPALLVAYGSFWILGFVLYALIYAAAGSLVSRAEDLQVLALPLSLIAIVGYIQAVMALTGGIGPIVRLASYVPFWSPFVMLTRLTIGRVEPWELALSFGLLAASIPVVAWIAIRVYSAGVLLYGQRPGARQIVAAVLNPPA